MKFIVRIILVAVVMFGVHQVNAQQVSNSQKTKAQLQLEEMFTSMNSQGVSKGRPKPIVINESHPRFKTLDELHPSFRAHLDPQLRPYKTAEVINVSAKPSSAAERKRNAQLQAIIQSRQ